MFVRGKRRADWALNAFRHIVKQLETALGEVQVERDKLKSKEKEVQVKLMDALESEEEIMRVMNKFREIFL